VSIIGTIIKAPFRAVNWGAKKVRGAMGSDEQESPIEQIVTSKYLLPYQYYFSSDHKTDIIGNNLIVWRKNIKKKEREKALKRLMGIT
jgi:hypothetical protein